MKPNNEPNILEMNNITKIYSNGFVANKSVNFRVRKGEIHALAGENGAGKTTLMKILFGIESGDGEILINGSPVKIGSPIEAIKNGIGMVHQHFMLVPSLTVAENVVLGYEPGNYGVIDMKKAVQLTAEASEKYNLNVNPYAVVDDIPVGIKQKVEILKALIRGAKILILDEPTAVLTPQESAELFVELKKLRDSGHTIIFISHKLDEIKNLCDRITILRRGCDMGVYNVREVNESDISKLMVGRDVVTGFAKNPAKTGENVLEVSRLSKTLDTGKKALNNISFSIRRGEILGVAGVEGNGQQELSEIISGMLSYTEGSVKISDVNINGLSVKKIRDLGVSHISEDRMTFGVVSDATVTENLEANLLYDKQFVSRGMLKKSKIKEYVDRKIKEYYIKCDSGDDMVKLLSGGNIQKVVVARECSSAPKLLIANQPTRGIDVGAAEFVRNKILSIRDEGCAIFLVSADLNEVLEMSDRLIVFCEGKIVAHIDEPGQLNETDLGEYMLGLKSQKSEEIERAFCHD
ncbi:MAG: ABC transporter ATP-binding protein [Oscillospiraceae bacterium]